MSYNLTNSQKDLLRWLVMQSRAGFLPDEFLVAQGGMGGRVGISFSGRQIDMTEDLPSSLTRVALQALAAEGLIILSITSEKGGSRVFRCKLLGKAFSAVESDFDSPNLSFVTNLSPLEDITKLDPEL
jgi:hypothetical protein